MAGTALPIWPNYWEHIAFVGVNLAFLAGLHGRVGGDC